MSDSTNKCISILNDLVRLATQYQLSISGEFVISRSREANGIDNELFSNVGLQYVNSNRLDFDGGIEIALLGIGELGNILTAYSEDCILFASIYNLNEDGTELEDYIIEDREDCDFLSVKKEIDANQAKALAQKLENYWNSDSIGSLRSFCAIKLGYAN
jgi:hypothetical protein